MGTDSSELFRKNDEAYQELRLKIEELSEDEILDLMIHIQIWFKDQSLKREVRPYWQILRKG
jgi:arsenate reductase-like glutaredoxin family protein